MHLHINDQHWSATFREAAAIHASLRLRVDRNAQRLQQILHHSTDVCPLSRLAIALNRNYIRTLQLATAILPTETTKYFLGIGSGSAAQCTHVQR
jgi:hypothetical protein